MPAPWVDIDLGEIRKLRFQHNDIADIEVATGKGLRALLDDQTGLQFHGVRVLLAYGLRWMDRKITPQSAGDLIQKYWIEQGKTLDELADVLQEALIAGGIVKRAEGKPTPDAESR